MSLPPNSNNFLSLNILAILAFVFRLANNTDRANIEWFGKIKGKGKKMSNKSLKKSRTFVLHKSSSMDLPTNSSLPHSTTMVHRKSNSIEFPTSPQAILGDDLLHFSHPQHPLSQVSLPDLFTCMGCKEFGAGNRFTCRQCDFQLHEFCALSPPALTDHPFHYQHQLVFNTKPGTLIS